MKTFIVLIIVAGACGGDKSNTTDARPASDAASCQLSAGCDFIVSNAAECPDPTQDPNFCTGICAGSECCYCEGTEEKIVNIECTDGCIDAGP